MPKTELLIAGGAYNMPSTQLDAQTCINWYPVVDKTGKFQMSLYPRPGLKLFSNDENEHSTRGHLALNSVLYVVIDDKLKAVYSDGTKKVLGTLNTSTGLVKLITNDLQVLICDGQYGYVYQIIATDVYDEGDFFQIKESSNIIGEPAFTGVGIDDLTTSGKYIGDLATKYVVQIDTENSVIAAPVFVGTGLNDLSSLGKYTGTKSETFTVKIDSIGIAPGVADTFKWSRDGGATWFATGVSISYAPQTLLDGVQILFAATTGHTVDDMWTIAVTVPQYSTTFRWSDNSGSTWNGTEVTITGTAQKLSNGVSISFNSLTGHTTGDMWTITIDVESSFFAPIFPAGQDGYGLYPQQGSNRIYLTAINDFNSIDPLDYQSANVYPDNNVAAISVNQEVYIIKEQTTEVWNNIGGGTGATFPFKPRSNFVINYGCEAAFTVAAGSNNIILFLGRNKTGARMVIKIDNYNASVVSTEPLNHEFRKYKKVSDAFADIIEVNSHIFYYITFPTEDKTWVYDLTTDMWTEWSSRIPETFPYHGYRFGRFRGMFHAIFGEKNIIGDSRSGKIFELDQNSFYDYDSAIEFERVTTHLFVQDGYVSLNSLMIDAERAVATQTGQGSEPTIMLQISRDGGKTWGDMLWRTSGKAGEYKHRALWYKLGTARQFTFKIRCTDPVFNVILGAIADIEATD